MSKTLQIRTVAVLGAGVMGAQIAAFFVSAGVKTYLFDLPGDDKDPSSIAKGAIRSLKKLHPSPLTLDSDADQILAANYGKDLDKLSECDFVIEAISERLEWKLDLYQKVVPKLNSHALFATNTSGLSIGKLAQALPEALRSRFLGVHFFNPPRYMKLVEFIPHESTNQELTQHLESFFVARLGKGVVYAKDTPNFIGNRIGVFAMLSVLHHAEQFGLAPDLVDALTGPVIGRPKSATFRTMDVVGLDTMKHVVGTMQQELASDPWSKTFVLPNWFNELVTKGALGQKSGVGIYKKEKGQIFVYDPRERSYRLSQAKASPEVLDILKAPLQSRFKALKESAHPQAQFLWSCFRDLFHYCAVHLETIASSTRDVDLAMKWGYGWQMGPFETWQLADSALLTGYIQDDIQNKKTKVSIPLPEWVKGDQAKPFYQKSGAYAPALNTFQLRSKLPVYERQKFPSALPEETFLNSTQVFENDGLVLWTLDNKHAIVSFKTRKNCISQSVLEGMLECIDRAEKDFQSLIIWQRSDVDFSVGANLKEVVGAVKARQFSQIDQMISSFHRVATRLKYAQVPTVAAISGLCLGGGTEFSLHTHARVSAMESYIGLPEAGIGLIPAGGGCKELACEAYRRANAPFDWKPLEKMFYQIAKGEVSSSAKNALERWFLKPSDRIVMNRDEILFEALRTADCLSGPQFYVSSARPVSVAGKAGIANFQAVLVNMREGNFITDHDYTVALHVAKVLCGGHVESGTDVDEAWLLDLEKEAFMELVEHELTLARIEHTLATGKPLRN